MNTNAINKIIKRGSIPDYKFLKNLRDNYGAATILCHPNVSWEEWGYDLSNQIDGYERHNSQQDYFKNDRVSLEKIKHLQAWHNSDAHCAAALQYSYNLLDVEITTEEQLIEYIKSGKEHEYYIKDRY